MCTSWYYAGVIFLSFLLWLLFFWAEGLPERVSLPHNGRVKVYVHPTLSKLHLWDYIGYVVFDDGSKTQLPSLRRYTGTPELEDFN